MRNWLRNWFRPAFHSHECRERFFAIASAAGKPRGLRWLSVEPNGEPIFAHDARGQMHALLPLIVSFEPIPGSDMEDVPAARIPRPILALFRHEGRTWTTDGRTIFNLTALQAVAMLGLRVVADRA